MRWQGRPAEDDTWITEDDLAHLRSDLLEPLPDTPTNLTKSSSSDPRRIGGVRPLPPPRHHTTVPEEPTPARVQSPDRRRQRMPISTTPSEDFISPRHITPRSCARGIIYSIFYYELS